MNKLTSPMRYQVFALVESTSVLGILDNMRYDRACPWQEYDARILEEGLSGLGSTKSVKFVITKYIESKGLTAWTLARWNGGGITLTPLTFEQAYRVERDIQYR